MSFSQLSSHSIGIGSVTVGDLFSAMLTLLVCIIVIKIFVHVVFRLLSKSKLDKRVQKYVVKGVKIIGYLITIILVIEALGVNSSSLVALLSVGSLGITLAAENILGNVAGGLVILSSRTFSIGDFIEVDGSSGTVEEIALNHTKLSAPDGTAIVIPNKTLSTSKFINYTALGQRRIAQKISASYDAPTETVKQACRAALKETVGLISTPAPVVHLTGYGSSSIEYTVYCWCRPQDYWDAYYALLENLRSAFKNFGVEMPYDHLNVHIVEENRLPAEKTIKK